MDPSIVVANKFCRESRTDPIRTPYKGSNGLGPQTEHCSEKNELMTRAQDFVKSWHEIIMRVIRGSECSSRFTLLTPLTALPMSYYHHTLSKTVFVCNFTSATCSRWPPLAVIAFNPEPAINIFDFLHPSHVSAFFFPRRWRVIRDGTKQSMMPSNTAVLTLRLPGL